MTRRISLRPAASAAALITFVAVVLSLLGSLLGVSSLALRRGTEVLQFAARSGQPQPGPSASPNQARPGAHQRPTSTASPALHRTSAHSAERRIPVAGFGQSAENHCPGGSPDLPVAVLPPGRQFFVDLADLPVDAYAEVVATTVSVSHRGRAPPASGYDI
ncbi:hypothetical protein LWF15_25140 [Kineosporia rhizophila]|uniref:hypothetical protein n=1 Tax=Kineosporia rhizophila TaxID=84633 RepID=UPI001E6210F6|nr:hypothetical protein [Kineosporia rhizophila]MCE0538790.1 hypothetical protein [Kineosporia rhizophila]